MSFWLEYDQNGSKHEYPFDSSSVSVGREKNADFVLDHPTVSRQHALIVKNNGGFKLVVLSRGGLTALDGNQVQGEVDLYDGSVVHFGQLSFTFRSAQAPPAPSQNAGGQSASGFGGAPAQGFGGAQPQGFSGQQQGQPASQQAQSQGLAGVGQQSQSQGFGGGQQTGGFGGGGEQAGGFGAAPAAGGTNGSQSGSFGGGNFGGGGFGGAEQAAGAQDSAPRDAPVDAPETNNGIMSWDAIAATADQDSHASAEGAGPTDFERIQAAAQKAEKQSKSNPVVLVGAGILIVGMLVFILMPQDATKTGGGQGPGDFRDLPPITFQPGVLDCVGNAECMAKARQSYKVGMETLDKVEVDIRNRFEGYRRLVMVEEFAKKAGHETLPAEFADLEPRRDQAREELDAIFQQLRVKYHNLGKRKMYPEMVDVLSEVSAIFPYKSAREHQWALKKERQLKEQGNYPQTFQ